MNKESLDAEPRPAHVRLAPRTTDAKRKGEMSEMLFAVRAANLGYSVSRPLGDSEPYDLIIEDDGRLIRIQVKSIYTRRFPAYRAKIRHKTGSDQRYSPKEVDFVAVYVVPEDSWYIIPVALLGGRDQIRLYPRGSKKKDGGRWEEFREAWSLLRPGAFVCAEPE